MTTFSTSQFKLGLKILIDGDPYTIVLNDIVKPGKGQAFNRIKVRNLKNGRVIEKTLKSGESIEAADVMEIELQYLYNDSTDWFFMDTTSFEQLSATMASVGDASKWLKGQEMCNVTIWNNVPIAVVPPNFALLEVTETDPGLRGDNSLARRRRYLFLLCFDCLYNESDGKFASIGFMFLLTETRTHQYVYQFSGDLQFQ